MSIKALPSMEHVFTIDLKGSETGNKFEGTFKYKRPNLRVQSEIAKTQALLNGGIQGLDEDTAFLHMMIANLRHTLTESPQWWKECDYGYELYDSNVIIEIFKQTREFEQNWINTVWGEKSQSTTEAKAE